MFRLAGVQRKRYWTPTALSCTASTRSHEACRILAETILKRRSKQTIPRVRAAWLNPWPPPRAALLRKLRPQAARMSGAGVDNLKISRQGYPHAFEQAGRRVLLPTSAMARGYGVNIGSHHGESAERKGLLPEAGSSKCCMAQGRREVTDQKLERLESSIEFRRTTDAQLLQASLRRQGRPARTR